MKTYNVIFSENCSDIQDDLCVLWNADNSLAKIGCLEQKKDKKQVYDLSELSGLFLTIVTGIASAVLYDSLKLLITRIFKKKNKSHNGIIIEIDESTQSIFISKKDGEINKDNI